MDFVSNVVTLSKPNEKIWAAVTQHQVDGRIAYRARRDSSGAVWFEWVLGDLYFPHTDGRGADIAWIEEWGEETRKHKYLRVERQRLDANSLTVKQHVFGMEGDTVMDEIDIKEYATAHEIDIPEDTEFQGVNELLCGAVTNDETLVYPRGRSALRNIDGLQEEINWTITRDSIVFEKHGKPKLAIPGPFGIRWPTKISVIMAVALYGMLIWKLCHLTKRQAQYRSTSPGMPRSSRASSMSPD